MPRPSVHLRLAGFMPGSLYLSNATGKRLPQRQRQINTSDATVALVGVNMENCASRSGPNRAELADRRYAAIWRLYVLTGLLLGAGLGGLFICC